MQNKLNKLASLVIRIVHATEVYKSGRVRVPVLNSDGAGDLLGVNQ